MRNLGVRSGLGRAVLIGGLLAVAACGDDDSDDTEVLDSSVVVRDDARVEEEEEDGGRDIDPPSRPDAGTKDASPPEEEDADAPDEADASSEPDGEVVGDASTPDASAFPALPSLLSLTGCTALQIPALCSVAQTDGAFTANCAGVTYTGTVGMDRAVTLTRPATTNTDGATVSLSCTGQLQVAGVLSAECKMNVTAAGDKPAAEETCALVSDRTILPGVACLELPSRIDAVVLCKEGAAAGGDTLTGGTCNIVQDGCTFQAECANNLTFAGNVSKTGITFTRPLKALADAATPTTGAPAFLRGAVANHSCTGTIADGKLTGACSAGGLRGGTPTSVCSNEGNITTPVVTCPRIAPTNEHFFVLDSCDLLKNGEGQTPGIGEPVCVFRQNNCIWDVQCGNDPLTKFGGRLAAGATRADFRLLTGTPCDIAFGPSGAATGKCTVPGQVACPLSSKPAVPGTASCPVLPPNTDPRSNGCAGGDPLACRQTVQHGCNVLSICSFTASFPDVIIAGVTSVQAGRAHFAFNGLGDYKCYVDQSTSAEIASGDRVANEWYGQCVNSAGGMCRNNYNAETKTGFRGLRVYWDAITP